MVWPHVALATRARQTRDGHRTRVPRMARRAIADAPVVLRLADRMALRTTAADRQAAGRREHRQLHGVPCAAHEFGGHRASAAHVWPMPHGARPFTNRDL